MSCSLNNLALADSEIPLKTFVKETNVESIHESKKSKFSLGFEGNEAKFAYEEIISSESKKEILPDNCNLKEKIEKSNINTKAGSNNSRKKTVNDNLGKNSNNVNTLLKAVELGDKDFVFENFNSENVNIFDQFGWTPLMSAAYLGHIEIADFLLKLGANVKAQDKSGFTAVDLAKKKNHTVVVNLIEQYIKKSKKNIVKKVCREKSYSEKLTNQEKLYCDICKMYFTESSQNKHESSMLHIFNTNPKVKNTFYGIPKCNRGYQMLLNKGWDEEGGLGPSGEGQKYPVKTILKRDRKGLGQSKKETPRVTHFNSRDTDAVKYINHKKRKTITKRERQKQLSKEAAKTRALRQALS